MDFSQNVSQIISFGAVSLNVHLAKELGIFDVLRAAEQPLTSQQVADARKLKERYVREILGCLTSASLVEVSTGPEEQTLLYHLDQDAKEALDDGALCKIGFISAVKTVYDPIKACCYLEGPKGSLIDDEEFRVLDERHIAGGDKVISYLCKKIPQLQTSLEQGIQVLEVGSGTGRLLSKLAERFPKSTFTASDKNDQILNKLKDSWAKLPNTRFETIDLCQTGHFSSTKYDWIFSVDVIHDLPHPGIALKNIRQMLKEDGGYYTCLDMAFPRGHLETAKNIEAAFYYSLSTFLCIPESFQQEDSEAHGAAWAKDTAVSFMREAGLSVEVDMLSDFEGCYICQCKI